MRHYLQEGVWYSIGYRLYGRRVVLHSPREERSEIGLLAYVLYSSQGPEGTSVVSGGPSPPGQVTIT